MSLISVEEALRLRQNRRLVFTNGVFDVLHVGHCRLLQTAAGLGDILIVGLNSDDSVRRLGKGPRRPYNSLCDRAEVLSALRYVDAVVAFDETTPEALIGILKPEVHVKGGDYRPDDLPEAKIIREYGGEIVIFPTLEGKSSTAILREMGAE